jgi:CubicO group peptidase (beta-lactamase class C family)
MKGILTIALLHLLILNNSFGQALYFPPVSGDQWESTSPVSQGYCPASIDSLYSMLERENSKAFILLKDGRIVLEKYFGGFTQDSLWYWASAGKSLTAFLVGLAQQDGLLSLSDKTSDHLGTEWTDTPAAKENLITIYHQLSMTSGLDDTSGNRDCTDPECLRYLADAGSRWAYHNAPYTLLDKVIENAAGQNLNIYSFQKLRNSTGISGSFLKLGYNNVFFSRARSMARFGLLVLNKGKWNNTEVMRDTAYFRQMVNSSQQLNKSYGYLWWLNGKSSFMVPQIPFVIQGNLVPDAPEDMIAALGRDGQILCVVPSQNLVWVRMGLSPETVPVPYLLGNKIWQYINRLQCSVAADDLFSKEISVIPNPTSDYITLDGVEYLTEYRITDWSGRVMQSGWFDRIINTDALKPGVYFITLKNKGRSKTLKWLKIS